MRVLFRLFHTVRFLKLKQIYYRIYYVSRKKVRNLLRISYPLQLESAPVQLKLAPSLVSPKSFTSDKTYTFLNQSHSFQDEIDWNYHGYGKLWAYNLNYFDWLQQNELPVQTAVEQIHDYIEKSHSLKDGLEPFPISIRGINWIKFISYNGINDPLINNTLLAHYHILTKHLEYHLLGNHLLENGFSLLFGACFFGNQHFFLKAKEILISELNEQILPDGAHFELSPMYHQIMLYRVLDCINVLKNNDLHKDDLLLFLEQKAAVMLGWLDKISFQSGHIPLFNDSANAIAPTTSELKKYAASLQIPSSSPTLSESGYRKKRSHNYECILDVGNIGPDYIPGHAHSDTFNFELYVRNIPLIVDTGTSTYTANSQRHSERSTSAHNTVMVNAKEQSEVWGGFRVANRAKIIALNESDELISATHDGYKHMGAYHTRTFDFRNGGIQINDIIGTSYPYGSTAYFHFHPERNPKLMNNSINAGDVTLMFSGEISNITLASYNYAPMFNTLIPAKVAVVEFKRHLKTEIII